MVSRASPVFGGASRGTPRHVPLLHSPLRGRHVLCRRQQRSSATIGRTQPRPRCGLDGRSATCRDGLGRNPFIARLRAEARKPTEALEPREKSRADWGFPSTALGTNSFSNRMSLRLPRLHLLSRKNRAMPDLFAAAEVRLHCAVQFEFRAMAMPGEVRIAVSGVTGHRRLARTSISSFLGGYSTVKILFALCVGRDSIRLRPMPWSAL
jgi:hypothetical protein